MDRVGVDPRPLLNGNSFLGFVVYLISKGVAEPFKENFRSNPTRSTLILFAQSVTRCTFEQGFKKKLAKAVKTT
jgi:hypothetical protein